MRHDRAIFQHATTTKSLLQPRYAAPSTPRSFASPATCTYCTAVWRPWFGTVALFLGDHRMPSLPVRDTFFASFVATSPAMLAVLSRVKLYAQARTPLLLVGATGTGKTTLAELVHVLSGRSGRFSAHTAREFDPELERSQIFGH